MITANHQPAQSAITDSPFEVTAAPVAPALPATSGGGCPACAYPIRRIYGGELICPNCGKRETLAKEFWERIGAACVWPGRGNWGKVGNSEGAT